jgi:RHS repeat-associated protein
MAGSGLELNTTYGAFGAARSGTTWSGAVSTADQTTMVDISRHGYTDHTMLGFGGLIHMNGRVQDSITGRFLSPDPYVTEPGNTQGYNRYAYVRNNPMSYIDPSGFREVCFDYTSILKSSDWGVITDSQGRVIGEGPTITNTTINNRHCMEIPDPPTGPGGTTGEGGGGESDTGILRTPQQVVGPPRKNCDEEGMFSISATPLPKSSTSLTPESQLSGVAALWALADKLGDVSDVALHEALKGPVAIAHVAEVALGAKSVLAPRDELDRAQGTQDLAVLSLGRTPLAPLTVPYSAGRLYDLAFNPSKLLIVVNINWRACYLF